MLCSGVAGYQCVRGPSCLHLQGEVTGDGEKGRRYRPGVQVGGRCCQPVGSRSGLAASAVSMRNEL